MLEPWVSRTPTWSTRLRQNRTETVARRAERGESLRTLGGKGGSDGAGVSPQADIAAVA